MRKKSTQYLVGFAAETERLVEQAAAKMAAKRVDLMVANDVTAPGSGFEVDTNRAVLIAPDGTARELPQMRQDRTGRRHLGPGGPANWRQ